MKITLHKFYVALVAVLCFGLNANAQTNAPWVGQTYTETVGGVDQLPSTKDVVKFFFSVTGYNGETASTVSATVYDYDYDYSFMVQLPPDGSVVDANTATFRAMMHDVNSLGVKPSEIRSHKVDIHTNVGVKNQTLGSANNNWLSHVYNFGGAIVPVTVVDYNHGATIKKEFTYTIQGVNNDLQIVGTPSSIQAAHDAWYLMTGKSFTPNNHVESNRLDTRDTYFRVANGSYLQIGNERITFNQQLDLSKDIFDMSTIAGLLKNNSTKVDVPFEKKVVFFLPAGSAFAIDQSCSTLREDATITIDLSNYTEGNLTLDGAISAIVNAADNNYNLIQALLTMFDNLVGMIDEAEYVPVEVRFGEPAFIQVFKGQETPETTLRTPAQFAEDLKERPNAVGYVWSNLNGVNYATPTNIAIADQSGVQNIVIDYPVGKNGHYYECNNFVLTDHDKSIVADFYTPKNFIALNLSYKRTGLKEYNSSCLPFALTKSDVKNDILYTFSNYVEDATPPLVRFTNQQNGINAGIPCIIKSNNQYWEMKKNNVEVIADPIYSTNMRGSFRKVAYGAQPGYYKLDDGVYKSFTSSSTCSPFRSFLVIDKDLASQVGSKMLRFVLDGDEESATKILDLSEGCEISEIYTLSGAKVNSLQRGVNVVKLTNGTITKIIK